MVLGNGPEAVVAILGAAVAAAAAPLNPACTEDEFRFYLEDVSARALIVPRGGAEAARRAWPAGAPLIEVALEAGGKLWLETSAPIAKRRTATAPGPDDVALVLHSSGTTGRPKRAALRHRNLAASAAQHRRDLRALLARHRALRDAALPHPRPGRLARSPPSRPAARW